MPVKYSSRVGKSVTKKIPSTTNVKKVLSKKSNKGGILPTPPEGTFVAQVEPHEAEETGGAISVGGKITPEMIDNMSYPAMIQTLMHMDSKTYGMIQGMAASYLNIHHPYSKPLRIALGGSFEHSKDVSKVATRDIIRSPNALRLGMALHDEWLEHMNGANTGGGLFSSLKMLVKKGVSGGKKALSKLAEGAKGAVRTLARGTKAGVMVAKSVSNAINEGLKVASVLEPAISQAFPKAGDVIKTAQALGRTGQEKLERGIGIAQGVSEGLDPIVQALGPVDAPLLEFE